MTAKGKFYASKCVKMHSTSLLMELQVICHLIRNSLKTDNAQYQRKYGKNRHFHKPLKRKEIGRVTSEKICQNVPKCKRRIPFDPTICF